MYISVFTPLHSNLFPTVATVNTKEPLHITSTTAKASHAFSSFICAVTQGLRCLAFRQLATTPTDGDNNFTHQAPNLGIVLDQFVFKKFFPLLSVELGGWAFNCQFESLLCDRQLLRAAMQVSI